MTVKELKEIIANLPEDMEVFSTDYYRLDAPTVSVKRVGNRDGETHQADGAEDIYFEVRDALVILP